MARLHLVTVEKVRNRMGVPNVEKANKIVSEVLSGVTETLESELRTRFDQEAGVVDRFYVPDSQLFGQQWTSELRLSRGLVTEATNDVKVELARTVLDLVLEVEDILDLRDPVASAPTVAHKDQFVLIELERGLVRIQDFRVLNRHVRVTYDAGIAADPNGKQYAQSGAASVPEWLKELAEVTALLELARNKSLGQELERGVQRAVRGSSVDLMEQRRRVLLDRHERYEPNAFQHLQTSIE